jgi:succinoglycan biosynthesis transport protein ExoP
MEKTERSLGEYLTTLRRRKGSLLSAMTVILLITISLAFGLPPVYRASATILIEQQEIPQDL